MTFKHFGRINDCPKKCLAVYYAIQVTTPVRNVISYTCQVESMLSNFSGVSLSKIPARAIKNFCWNLLPTAHCKTRNSDYKSRYLSGLNERKLLFGPLSSKHVASPHLIGYRKMYNELIRIHHTRRCGVNKNKRNKEGDVDRFGARFLENTVESRLWSSAKTGPDNPPGDDDGFAFLTPIPESIRRDTRRLRRLYFSSMGFSLKTFFLNNIPQLLSFPLFLRCYFDKIQRNAWCTRRNLTNIRKLFYASYGAPENSCSWAEESPIKKPCETGVRWPVNGSRVSNPRFRDVPFMLSKVMRRREVTAKYNYHNTFRER